MPDQFEKSVAVIPIGIREDDWTGKPGEKTVERV